MIYFRENGTNIRKLKQLYPNGRIPAGLLQTGSDGILKGMKYMHMLYAIVYFALQILYILNI